jgi:hypothetical protein
MSRISTAPCHPDFPIGTITSSMAKATGFQSRLVRGETKTVFGPFLTREEAYRAVADHAFMTGHPEEDFNVYHYTSSIDVPPDHTRLDRFDFAKNLLRPTHFRFLTDLPRKCNVLGA